MPEEPDPFNDPNAPDMPPMPDRNAQRAEYYESRYGKDNPYAKRWRGREAAAGGGEGGGPPPQSPSGEMPPSSYGSGGMGPPSPNASAGVGGDNSLADAIRELSQALRQISGT